MNPVEAKSCSKWNDFVALLLIDLLFPVFWHLSKPTAKTDICSDSVFLGVRGFPELSWDFPNRVSTIDGIFPRVFQRGKWAMTWPFHCNIIEGKDQLPVISPALGYFGSFVLETSMQIYHWGIPWYSHSHYMVGFILLYRHFS